MIKLLEEDRIKLTCPISLSCTLLIELSKRFFNSTEGQHPTVIILEPELWYSQNLFELSRMLKKTDSLSHIVITYGASSLPDNIVILTDGINVMWHIINE